MSFLDELQKKIEIAEKELEDLKAAYRVLSRDNLSSSQDIDEETPQIGLKKLGDSGTINLDDLGLPSKTAPKINTLSETVMNVVRRFDKKEFTVNHVCAALKQMGKVKTNPKHYKNRVSMVVRKLADEGVIEKTHKGSGNDPHRYREAAQVSLVKNEK